MVDYTELMDYLSMPRPSGSEDERKTVQALLEWLNRDTIAYQLHKFRLYPNFFITIGVWLILSRSLLVVSVWLRWGWPSLLIAFIGLLGGLVDVALNFPLITWIGAKQAENILIEFEPENTEQEIVISAHYDSKTELLDHRKRLFFIKNLRLGIVLTVLLGFLAPFDQYLLSLGSTWTNIVYSTGVILSLVLLFLAWGLGLNLTLGRLLPPSQGAVDNGAACAILLGLAHRVNKNEIPLERTRLTLALFAGEEVNMQGSRAYISSRHWHIPTVALNLEVMAQNGKYVYWEQDGSALKLIPTSGKINKVISESVDRVTGSPACPVGPVNSDAGSFLQAGIPATTLGTYDRNLVDRGFHGPGDNLDRVVMARLPEAVDILSDFIMRYENGQASMQRDAIGSEN